MVGQLPTLERPYHHQEDQSDQGSQEDPQEDPPEENELSVVISPLSLSEPPIPNETCATAGPAVRAIITAIRASTTNILGNSEHVCIKKSRGC